jgi:hypothetical protein
MIECRWRRPLGETDDGIHVVVMLEIGIQVHWTVENVLPTRQGVDDAMDGKLQRGGFPIRSRPGQLLLRNTDEPEGCGPGASDAQLVQSWPDTLLISSLIVRSPSRQSSIDEGEIQVLCTSGRATGSDWLYSNKVIRRVRVQDAPALSRIGPLCLQLVCVPEMRPG